MWHPRRDRPEVPVPPDPEPWRIQSIEPPACCRHCGQDVRPLSALRYWCDACGRTTDADVELVRDRFVVVAVKQQPDGSFTLREL